MSSETPEAQASLGFTISAPKKTKYVHWMFSLLHELYSAAGSSKESKSTKQISHPLRKNIFQKSMRMVHLSGVFLLLEILIDARAAAKTRKGTQGPSLSH